MTYAEIDLSTPVIGAISALDVALDDTAKAAFLYGDEFTRHSVVWENGTASSPHDFPTTGGSQSGSGWSFYAKYVATSGAVAGTGTRWQADPIEPPNPDNYQNGTALCPPGGEPAFQRLLKPGCGNSLSLRGFPGGTLLWGSNDDPRRTATPRVQAFIGGTSFPASHGGPEFFSRSGRGHRSGHWPHWPRHLRPLCRRRHSGGPPRQSPLRPRRRRHRSGRR